MLLVTGCLGEQGRPEPQPSPGVEQPGTTPPSTGGTSTPPAGGVQPPAATDQPAKKGPPYKSDNFVLETDLTQKVGERLKLKGQARVFEGRFIVAVEDGHNQLAYRHVSAKAGAPEFADFEVELELPPATQPNGTLLIGFASPKDGATVWELTLPIQFERVQYMAEPPKGK